MPVKTFTSTTLTASDVNTYLMDQAVVTCTSATRPTGIEGRVIFETDTDTLRVYDGSSWVAIWRKQTTYTPTLVGMAVGTGGSAENTATYGFSGGTLTVSGNIVFGTTGTTFPASTITASLPSGFTASPVYSATAAGIASMTDASVGTYTGYCRLQSASTVRFVVSNTSGTYPTQVSTSTTVPFTWAAGDSITWAASIAGSF